MQIIGLLDGGINILGTCSAHTLHHNGVVIANLDTTNGYFASWISLNFQSRGSLNGHFVEKHVRNSCQRAILLY